MKKRDIKEDLAPIYTHRGYHNKPEIPENSMPAFRRAVSNGFGSELDVHLIADGSLAVFHDELLARETGARGEIEDYDLSNLGKLRLEGTDETIPTFDEVLALYEGTGLPLMIELKTNRGNHRELAEAVCARMDSYSGPFALQSFDPRAVLWIKKLRPAFTRGQLLQDFNKDREGLPGWQAALLTALAANALTQPDFLNCRYSDRSLMSLRKRIDKGGMPEVTWTIRTEKDLADSLRQGCIPIFEGIEPEKVKEILRRIL